MPYKARCPCHEDHTPTLSSKEWPTGFCCTASPACPSTTLSRSRPGPGAVTGPRQIVATDCYRDAAGLSCARKSAMPQGLPYSHREEAGNGSTRPAGSRRALTPCRNSARHRPGRHSLRGGGRKDCDRLAAGGLTATTNIEGARNRTRKPSGGGNTPPNWPAPARVGLAPDHDAPASAHGGHRPGAPGPGERRCGC